MEYNCRCSSNHPRIGNIRNTYEGAICINCGVVFANHYVSNSTHQPKPTNIEDLAVIDVYSWAKEIKYGRKKNGNLSIRMTGPIIHNAILVTSNGNSVKPILEKDNYVVWVTVNDKNQKE